jgi:hypothetical protein
MGAEGIAYGEVGGQAFSMCFQGERSWAIGETISAFFDTGSASLFSTSGERL